jgi:hypothetical protein
MSLEMPLATEEQFPSLAGAESSLLAYVAPGTTFGSGGITPAARDIPTNSAGC